VLRNIRWRPSWQSRGSKNRNDNGRAARNWRCCCRASATTNRQRRIATAVEATRRSGRHPIGRNGESRRNCYFNDRRIARRTVWLNPAPERAIVQQPQEAEAILHEVERLLDNLPSGYREAISRVILKGESYEAAAIATGCAVGKINGRLFRTRSQLVAQANAAARRQAQVWRGVRQAAQTSAGRQDEERPT
jgi:DNA-directed RNA polymerase specialized sigma24 family protein